MENSPSQPEWAAGGLADPARWTPALRTAAAIVDSAAVPFALYWGDNFLQIFNRAWAQTIGESACAFGQPASQCWQSAWEQLRSPLQAALQGKSASIEISIPGGRLDLAFTPVADPDAPSGYGGVLLLARQIPLFSAEQELRLIADATPAYLAHCDPQGRYLFINQAYAKRFGLNPKEIIGKHISEVIGRDAFEDIRPHVEAVLRGEPVEFEQELTYDKLGRRFLHVSYAPDFDGSGRVRSFLAAITDITGRRQIELALRDAEQRYRALVDLSPQLVFMAEPDGSISFVNRYAEQVTGYPVKELLGTGWPKAVHPDWRELVYRTWLNAIIQKTTYDIEYPMLWPDGREVWVAIRARPIQDSAGNVEYWIGVGIDITRRKLAEDRLREQQRFTETILGAAPMLTYVFNLATGRHVFMSSQSIPILGYRPEELLAMDPPTLAAMMHPDDQRHINEKLDQIRAAAGDEVYEHEFRLRRKDGEWITVLSRDRVFERDERGLPVQILGVGADITARKQADAVIHRQSQIIELSYEPTLVWTRDGRIVEWNAGAEQTYGYSKAEAVGRIAHDLLQTIHPIPIAEVAAQLEREGQWSGELRHVAKNGSHVIVESRQQLLKLDAGHFIVETNRDVTERRRYEAELQRLASVVDNSQDFIGVANLEGAIVYVNKAGQQMVGAADLEECCRTPITDLIAYDDRALVRDVVTPALIHQGRWSGEFKLRNLRTGREVPVIYDGFRIDDPHTGRPVSLATIMRDITERKQAELAIEQSEARFRQLADSMPLIIWTANPDGYIDYFNQRWYEFTGNARGYGGPAWEAFLHPEDLPQCQQIWSAAVASGDPCTIQCRLWDTRHNRWRWFMGRAVAITGTSGNVAKWFGSLVDIDDQKRIEEDLRRANFDLEQFAYSASHDLKEPLRGIAIYSQLLERKLARHADDETKAFLHFLRTGAHRMETLIGDLLAYTQLGLGRSTAQETSAGDSVNAAIAALAGAIAESGAQVTAETLPAVRIDRTHLQQIFQNLIGNAIKYRHPERPPVIAVASERRAAELVFWVTDNGIGIESQYKERIFGLFKRLHTAETYPGTGIGLALCWRIVERYGGRIWVESTLGQGSTFFFSVPV